MTPSLAPSKHRQHLSLSLHSAVAEGGGTFEESTFHFTPSFSRRKEEFSTYPSSGLCWRDTQHVEGEACGRATYFSGQSGHTDAVSSTEDLITHQKTVRLLHLLPALLLELSHSARSSQKGCTPNSVF